MGSYVALAATQLAAMQDRADVMPRECEKLAL